MTSVPDDDVLDREHRKREACWDPAQRWRVLQETITWSECQMPVRRNSPARCLELQRAKLGQRANPKTGTGT